MVVGLVPPEEQEKLYEKLIQYYKKLYPGMKFRREDRKLRKEQIGEIFYTYAGEETESTAIEKMKMINTAIGHGYSTPIILLQRPKDKKYVLIDGHRRVRVAWTLGLEWPAIIIIPDTDTTFGIEAMITGRVKDLFGKE
jgi:hypothetical protein